MFANRDPKLLRMNKNINEEHGRSYMGEVGS